MAQGEASRQVGSVSAPAGGAPSISTRQSADQSQSPVAAPVISLPKGGGAIRGIGEKFSASPSGGGSMSVPLAISPGRSGFGPQLALTYDSGSGNGPFGLGWGLALPSITRKTDKGLPQYRDLEDSDVFILSGAEDLVPALEEKNGVWVPVAVPERSVGPHSYVIRRYRPRTEGLFARIERWTRKSDGDTHWRSISRDNVTTLYGLTEESRITDPDAKHRVFSWLVCESYDDKGNAMVYEYAPEDSAGIVATRLCERNRTADSRSANRYLKRIKYGNRKSRIESPLQYKDAGWLFEVVFDYGEGHWAALPSRGDGHDYVKASAATAGKWPVRKDPHSSFRCSFHSGVHGYRLCRRVLMFHSFAELGDTPCLVRSTDLAYDENPVASTVGAITQSGYVRQKNNAGVWIDEYLVKSVPPVEFTYSKVPDAQEIAKLPVETLNDHENLPIGLDGAQYQFVDLDGEGVSGILSQRPGAWYYKPNLGEGRFGAMAPVVAMPTIAQPGGHHQLLDLAGDGQLDVVLFKGPLPGFNERNDEQSWEPFRTFTSMPHVAWDDPNLKFVDLTGDGHADLVISEHEAFVWHASLAEDGFGPALRVAKALDEEKGPRSVFADGTQTVFLSDMSGDGLADLVRIRNREICYWPNLGYGRFGAKVTMENAPWFDEQFDPKLIRLADTDGNGVTDILYLGRSARLYLNQSGFSWGDAIELPQFPVSDSLASVQLLDLLGRGTSCLVWSTPLPGNDGREMRYVDLMAGRKPHLLVKTVNNLGAETLVDYAASTKFYLEDKRDGKPWITRLPFPVHVVERVTTLDRISGNRFVTRYSYHHGYFDGIEREFRGFGRVDQLDTEEFAAFAGGAFPAATNIDEAAHVLPVLTKTWYHTGAYLGRDRISSFFAGMADVSDVGEYYREPAWRDDDVEAAKRILDDTNLPPGLSIEEDHEACRALKGSLLRREIYALDGTTTEAYPHGHPYIVTEQNFAIQRTQPKGGNRYAVFLAYPVEALSYHYERNSLDPRITHSVTLEVDRYGSVSKSLSIGYGRKRGRSPLGGEDRNKQERTLIAYTENDFTIPIDDSLAYPDDYRTPSPCETRTYEVTGFEPAASAVRIAFADFAGEDGDFAPLLSLREIGYEASTDYTRKQRRLIEHVRTVYRKDDLTGLLKPGQLEPLALSGESYKVAFTSELIDLVYVRAGQRLLPVDPAGVLKGSGADRGGYLDLDRDGRWWIPSGRMYYSRTPADSPAAERDYAKRHFFLPHLFEDTFGQNTFVSYDAYDLLVVRTQDAVANALTAENDYRVLQPKVVADANRNRAEAAFDALGLVAGTAVKGKDDTVGDTLNGFASDLTQAQLDGFFDAAEPHASAPDLLKGASSRIVYDLDRFWRTRQAHPDKPGQWLPAYTATLARETHVSDGLLAQGLKIQISFSYSDGFGREIQKKLQAEPGQPLAGGHAVSRRWVGSGWTVFNNKGKPVRQFEPFFSQLVEKRHRYEFGVDVGVSPFLVYDPVGRVVATLHPNCTYEKVLFDPWQQVTYDVNDTVAPAGNETGDPRTDAHLKGYMRAYFKTQPPDWQTWYQQRITGAKGAEQKSAAEKAAKHANTPTIAHYDTLGRPFLTLAHHGLNADGTPIQSATRVELDIEGNRRAVRDAIAQGGDPEGRIVMRCDYDLLGNRIHEISMEAGERWTLNDAAGKRIRAWDSRNHSFRTEYDRLRRPLRSFVAGVDPADSNQEYLTERLLYGEQHPQGDLRNLRGRLFLHLDQAGVAASESYDFKSNLLRASRRFTREYRKAINWSAIDAVLPADPEAKLDSAALDAVLAPLLEPESFASRTVYDALNRPIQLIAPCSDQAGPRRHVVQPAYSEANLLQRVDVWLDQPAEPAGLLDSAAVPSSPVGVSNIDYDAKGQRLRIEYKNGVATQYAYDPQTFRLVHLNTRRGAAFDDDLQNLRYTFDSTGNITSIRDDAQQAVYFRNRQVEPSAEYTYDALYRLIEASGREHLGQAGGAPIPHSHDDRLRVGIDWAANDGNAMGRYIEQYVYDAVGNIEQIIHRGTDPAHPGWTRTYEYDETSLIENGIAGAPRKASNRITRTVLGPDNTPEPYAHDAHGNMIRMPHLGGAHPGPNMHWDYQDRLRQLDLGGGGIVHYVYDAGGQRVRKVWRKAPGLTEERFYLGGFELYRRQNATATVTLERETLHVMAEKERIALVELRTLDTAGNDAAPRQLVRYQLANHQGSASLELDEHSQIVSYEEYTPYGSTSYQAVRSQTDTPKRYRYTGEERDAECGFCYHRARYFAPWLGRWLSPDPAQTIDGVNLYAYGRNRPLTFSDASGLYALGDDKSKKVDFRTRQQFQQALNAWAKELPDVDFDEKLKTLASDYNAPATEQKVQTVAGFTPKGKTFSYHKNLGKYVDVGGFPLDLEHFLKNAELQQGSWVAGVKSHLLLGTVEEAYQAISPYSDPNDPKKQAAARSSSFSPEDLMSNALGLLFYERADKSMTFEAYTDAFFKEMATMFTEGEKFKGGKFITKEDLELLKAQSPTGKLEDVRKNSKLYSKKAHEKRVTDVQKVINDDAEFKFFLENIYGLKDLDPDKGRMRQALDALGSAWETAKKQASDTAESLWNRAKALF